MIFSVTPNPALDLGGTVDKILKNEKNYVFGETRFPGGNGINAARIAHRLGSSVTVSGFLGGSVGEEIKELLEKERLKHRFVTISGHSRINLTVSNETNHEQTRLSFPGPKIKKSELRSLRILLRQQPTSTLAIIGGSLPSGLRGNDIRILVEELRSRRINTIVDMPGNVLKTVHYAKPLLIKPNLHEFQVMTGKKIERVGAVASAAKRFTENVPLICVSSVENGAILVCRKTAWFGRIPKVKIRSSVGAGDSMVGAMAEMLVRRGLHRKGHEELHSILDLYCSNLLRWALAAACATLTERGTQLGRKNSIRKYYSSVTIQEL
ncbi:MAG: hexose kinase [Bdellovibrionia bacterium]